MWTRWRTMRRMTRVGVLVALALILGASGTLFYAWAAGTQFFVANIAPQVNSTSTVGLDVGLSARKWRHGWFAGTVTANSFSGAFSGTLGGLTANRMLMSNASGQVAVTTAPTDGQILIGRSGNAATLGTITGTSNRVTVTNGGGTITLSGPQDLGTTSTPAFGGITVGSGGTALTQIVKIAQSLSPTLMAAPTPDGTMVSAEESFTVNGLTTGDTVFVNGPAPTAFCPMVAARVSAASTLTLTFMQITTADCQPASGTYTLTAIRS